MSWQLTNGLVMAVPGPEPGQITVLSWSGSAWESPTELNLTIAAVSLSDFSGVSILRNSPEATTIRLNVATTAETAFGNLDLTVRRGDRNVLGVLRLLGAAGLAVGVTGAFTSITGAVRQTANDDDGNRAVLSSAAGTLSTAGGGGAASTVSGTVLDFGLGHEIGGSGAAGIETAQSLANQYAAFVSERVDVVAA